MESTVTVDPSGDRPTKRPGYGQLLRTPKAWTFLLPGFAARLPFAMLTISLVLLVQHTTGSYGVAGAVAAVAGVSMALLAPQAGKLADRFGQRAVLVPGVLLHSAAVALLTVLALTGAPLWTLFAAAVPTGASVPQIGPMVRSRWAARLGDTPLAGTAAAFESVTDELTFVLGPVIATALCTGVHPAAGLAAEGALSLLGGLLFAAQRSTQPEVTPRPAAGAAPAGASRSALSVAGVRVLAVAFLGIGTVFGGLQVSLTAFAEEAGHPGMNGLLYGVFAAGNTLAGIVYGVVAWSAPPQRRLLVGYAALAVSASTLWAMPSLAPLAVAGLLTGLCVAPALITGYTLIDSLVPPGARTESGTWLTGAVALGQAGAVTASGTLADAFGARAGFAVPLGGTVLALVVLVALRSRLVPRPGGAGRGPVASGGTGRGVGHRTPAAVD
ncbi:MFS transporter [Streptomyces sp. DEF1AK]|uniref:MFS transporter n=1 Tax=Streptomyces sp. DEF1AK TaxID=2759677 RepID=UPI00191690C8|nr:MFS transporter [Streptomyces sp. DEF1AK]MBK3391219.1 MFS transporter [Streptomyces sp. DEF1AK]